MSIHTLFSCIGRRSLSVGALGGFVLAAVTTMPVSAQQAADKGVAAPSSFSNQIVVRDHETGRLRAPTAEEAEALHGQGRSVEAPGQLRTQPRAHSSGARGARLTDEFLSHSVLVRQPDGRLLEYCFESREAANAALNAPAASPVKNANLPTE